MAVHEVRVVVSDVTTAVADQARAPAAAAVRRAWEVSEAAVVARVAAVAAAASAVVAEVVVAAAVAVAVVAEDEGGKER